MNYLDKELSEVTAEDILKLKDLGIAEDAYIDYKRDWYNLSKDSEKKDFLLDVCSFANAYGGDIIYGVEEDGGIPENFSGVEINEDLDEFKLRIGQILKSSIEPVIMDLQYEAIPYNDRFFFVVRIPPSFYAPHMVKSSKSTFFYKRYNNGNSAMTHVEIRDAFLRHPKRIEEFENFISDRKKIISEEMNKPFLLLHAIPLLRRDNFRNVSDNYLMGKLNRFSFDLINANIATHKFEGFFIYSHEPTEEYCLYFRDGTIEIALGYDYYYEDNKIFGSYLEGKIVDVYRKINEKVIKDNLISLPYCFTVSLANCKDMYINFDFSAGLGDINIYGRRITRKNIKINRDLLRYPLVYVNDSQKASDKDLKFLLDILYNTAGYPYCPFYKDGAFIKDISRF